MKKQTTLKPSNTDNLVVGKFYNVPCAKVVNIMGKHRFVPVIGVEHVDKDFFNEPHYHIDGRFCGGDVPVAHMDYHGRTNGVIGTRSSLTVGWIFDSIEVKKRKCKRLTTGINPPSGKYNFDKTKFGIWAQKMTGKSCKGKRCPHLGTTMLECQGRLVCPLHNLASDEKHEAIEGLASFRSGQLEVYKFL